MLRSWAHNRCWHLLDCHGMRSNIGICSCNVHLETSSSYNLLACKQDCAHLTLPLHCCVFTDATAAAAGTTAKVHASAPKWSDLLTSSLTKGCLRGGNMPVLGCRGSGTLKSRIWSAQMISLMLSTLTTIAFSRMKIAVGYGMGACAACHVCICGA